MARKPRSTTSAMKTTIKLDSDVHAWLTLLSEKYGVTLSGVIAKFVEEHEPEIIEAHNQIKSIKNRVIGAEE
jgi:macrodomain Ter protein organizer (MatP/YcbG family)